MPASWDRWDENLVARALETRATLDAPDRDGVTALWHAVYFGRAAEVSQLLAAGARLDAHDPGRVDRTAGSGHVVSAYHGRPSDRVDAPVGRSTLLHVAAARIGDPDVIDQLLAAGVPIDGRDAYGCTPLHIAAFAKRDRAVEHLLARGAGPNTVCRAGCTPLIHGWDAIPVLQSLLAHGADPLLGDVDPSLLASIAYFGRDDVFRALIAHDRRIAQDPTALPIACKHGKAAVAKLLLAAGTPVDGSIEWRGSLRGPLEAAAMYAHQDCAELVLPGCRHALDAALVAAVAFSAEDSETPPNNRARERRGLVTWLLEQGARADAALAVAATLHDEAYARILLAQGARADTMDADGEPVLIRAAQLGRHRVVRLLLGAGADPKTRAKDGALAYEVAARAYRRDGIDDARIAMNALSEAGGEPVAAPAAAPVAASGAPAAGGRVTHAKFGVGIIQRIDGEKLTIAFESGETRTLMAKFVTLAS